MSNLTRPLTTVVPEKLSNLTRALTTFWLMLTWVLRSKVSIFSVKTMMFLWSTGSFPNDLLKDISPGTIFFFTKTCWFCNLLLSTIDGWRLLMDDDLLMDYACWWKTIYGVFSKWLFLSEVFVNFIFIAIVNIVYNNVLILQSDSKIFCR